MDYNKQTITVKYTDKDVTVRCPHDTIKVTDIGIFVLDINKLMDKVSKQLEKEIGK